jgi:two-component system response regulator
MMMADQTILLVEDNPDDALLTRRTLKKNNICNDVVLARNGAEALDYLFGRGSYEGRDLRAMPQVILLDLSLPKIDGFEVLRRIRSDERTRLLPTVILTCSEDQEDLVKSMGIGANSYVRKPVEVAQFRAVVGELGMYWIGLERGSKEVNTY